MYMFHDGRQLSVQIMHRVLEEMRTGSYRDMVRLPPEVDIAESLGVSRTAVRDGLSILEREGYVTRKHGLGTVINRQVLNLATRIDVEKEFLEMVRDAGYKPTVSGVRAYHCVADEEKARALNIRAGDELLCISRVICGDDMPVIYCQDYVPCAIIVDEKYEQSNFECPIYDFLENSCNTAIHMDLSELHADNAGEELAQIMQVPVGSALLGMKEVGYTLEGKPVLYSREYYRDMLKHTLLRLKI